MRNKCFQLIKLRKRYKLFALFPVAIITLNLVSTSSKATTYTIQASNFQFSPDSISMLVGDTIKWLWIDGNHTSTSNGIPETAAPWNVLLDSFHTSYTYRVTADGFYHYISVPDLPGMEGLFIATWPVGIPNPSSPLADFEITPNVVTSNFILQISLSEPQAASISLYDVAGRRLEILLDETINAGQSGLNIHLSKRFPPGIYIVSLRLENATLSKRIVIQ